eukprot:gnl/MRDRNA2_/MRDRNA2_117994_c0_seq1.p1 gnl/MRDRNA2_/MRDRNA2_117994_c0~~gnl/MRDRNA2_/MRDRNA2_117994_c0_seq1.p1  ORF type:complete len:168 (-),score=26.19 gnl/MRDRNA2_/MRDRNA2_117994_c0_seq1:112-615(-)
MAFRLFLASAFLIPAGARKRLTSAGHHRLREDIGCYADPNHMIGKEGAPRTVTLNGDTGKIVGKDTADGDIWEVPFTIEHDSNSGAGHEGDRITVDFSAKGGPAKLVGEIKGDTIKWQDEDGNTWTKGEGCKDLVLSSTPEVEAKSTAYYLKFTSALALALWANALA